MQGVLRGTYPGGRGSDTPPGDWYTQVGPSMGVPEGCWGALGGESPGSGIRFWDWRASRAALAWATMSWAVARVLAASARMLADRSAISRAMSLRTRRDSGRWARGR